MTPIELTEARESLHLTQRDLSRYLGLVPTTINRYERGHAVIPEVVRYAMVGLAYELTNRDAIQILQKAS